VGWFFVDFVSFSLETPTLKENGSSRGLEADVVAFACSAIPFPSFVVVVLWGRGGAVSTFSLSVSPS
jgi:hypothetical protein